MRVSMVSSPAVYSALLCSWFCVAIPAHTCQCPAHCFTAYLPPVCSMLACLPPLLARAAVDEDEGLPALHGSSSRDVFPVDVSALIDLSGKRWAHTAVVRLPFPDVDAVCQFVRQQLSDDDCHLSAEERSRKEVQPALLLLSGFHPLAASLFGGSSAASAEGAGAEPGSAARGRAAAQRG